VAYFYTALMAQFVAALDTPTRKTT
jgi:hypothetical protein